MTASLVDTPSVGAQSAASPPTPKKALDAYRRVRSQSEALCEPLETEDYVIQTADFASPAKWHLSHVSWFFETFLLEPYVDGYQAFDPLFTYLFNSYYQGVGSPFPRPERGALSRPTVKQVYAYRAHVDRAMAELLENPPSQHSADIQCRLALGLNHEQQHQELLLMDLKYNLSRNPVLPAYRNGELERCPEAKPLNWIDYDAGVVSVGFSGAASDGTLFDGFCFDNEGPRHRVFLEPYRLADRLVTNSEYQAFIADGGYDRHELWLSDGWEACRRQAWRAPLYWFERDGEPMEYTLDGPHTLDPHAPVCHVSFYEADAYARWAGARLATEFEWEHAAAGLEPTGHFVDSGRLHPFAAKDAGEPANAPRQCFGDLWEWTSSDYGPYPGFRPDEGAIGEYNGKFMCNQRVLRGGCCVTPAGHTRLTYRNFFYPDQRWAFNGIRLAAGSS